MIKSAPQCAHILLIMKDRKDGFYYKCSNSACNYKEFIKEDKQKSTENSKKLNENKLSD